MINDSKEDFEDELQNEIIEDEAELENEDESSEEDNYEEELEELEESDSTAGVTSDMTRANMVSVAMKKLVGLKSDKLVDFFNKSIASIGNESDAVSDDAHKKNRASVLTKGAIKEDLATIFGDDKSLTEEFKTKLETLFESAVGMRVSLIEAELQDAYESALEEQTEEITNELIEQVDNYLNRICEDWIEENKVAIETSLVNEMNNDFILGLRDLFNEHYYADIPENKVDVVELLSQRVEKLEEGLNDTAKENMELLEILKEKEKKELVEEVATGLSVSQVEKFKTLVEDIDYEGDDEKFVEKLELIKEHHFTNKKPVVRKSQLINEEVFADDEQEEKPVNPQVKRYFDAIGRT